MALLADLTGATDPVLRGLARRLAGRLFLDLSKRGPTRPRGVGKLQTRRYRPDGGDIDIDASIDALLTARGEGRAIDPEELRIRSWTTPDTAICLMVDRSGSMGGAPLATSAVAAAAVAWRAPEDYSVLSFGKDVVAAKSHDATKSSEAVVDAVLALRGFGTTDVVRALDAATEQLSRSRAGRKIAVLQDHHRFGPLGCCSSARSSTGFLSSTARGPGGRSPLEIVPSSVQERLRAADRGVGEEALIVVFCNDYRDRGERHCINGGFGCAARRGFGCGAGGTIVARGH